MRQALVNNRHVRMGVVVLSHALLLHVIITNIRCKCTVEIFTYVIFVYYIECQSYI